MEQILLASSRASDIRSKLGKASRVKKVEYNFDEEELWSIYLRLGRGSGMFYPAIRNEQSAHATSPNIDLGPVFSRVIDTSMVYLKPPHLWAQDSAKRDHR